METCRRSRGRTVILCVHGLVAVPVLQRMSDIGRQRHLSQTVQYLLKYAVILEADVPVPVVDDLCNFPGEKPVPEGQAGPRPAFFAGLYQSLPFGFPARKAFQKKDLHSGARILFHADEPRGDHLRIIDDEAVPGIQIIHNLPEHMMLNLPRLPVQNHQPGGSAVLQRILGNQFFGKIIPEITCFHSFVSQSVR